MGPMYDSVTFAYAERSFSKLKIKKNYFWVKISQERSSGLSMIFIVKSLSDIINYNEIIKKFVVIKLRKKIF